MITKPHHIQKEEEMKRISTIVVILFLVVNFIVLTDAEARYFTAELGLAQPDEYNETNFGSTEWEFDDGTNFSFAYGSSLKETFRLEGEFSYLRQLDFKNRIFIPTGTQQSGSGDQTQVSLMFNGIWQIMPEWKVSPFLGGGIGFTKISWNDVNPGALDDSDTVFTYQIFVGGSVRITNNLFIEGTYYYVKPDDVDITDINGITGKLDNQQLNIFTFGIRYNF
jgi:opacity protein-like surface antigen